MFQMVCLSVLLAPFAWAIDCMPRDVCDSW